MRMCNSIMTRRELLKRGGMTGLAFGIGMTSGLAWPRPAPAQNQLASGRQVQLTEFIWVGGGQGVVPREVKAAFEKTHPNISIELYEGTNTITYPKIIAQRQVDPNKPLINFGFFNQSAQTKGERDDLWLSLDPKKIPNMASVYPAFRHQNNVGVTWGMNSIGLVYNKALVKDPPTSWNDIFAPRFKGKVILVDYAWEANGLLGVAYADGGDAKHIDAAFEKFSRAAQDKQFLAIVSTPEQIKDSMARGEALFTPYYTGFAITWNQESTNGKGPFAYTIPKEGVIPSNESFNIIKGSSQDQIDAASAIINQALELSTIERYCNLTADIPTVRGVKLKPELEQEAAFQPSAIEHAIRVDWNTVYAQDNAWKQRWDREVKAKM